MKIIVLSITHPLQLLEDPADTEDLQTSKAQLRAILEAQFAKKSVGAIFEECSFTKESIAAELARAHDPEVPWHNICMTETERKAAGIYDALRNRPSRPDDNMEYTIEERIPEDEIREEYFVEQILTEEHVEGDVLVLVGDMHAEPVANRLRARRHNVEVRGELVPIKRWTDSRILEVQQPPED
jgi:hypothetical protein